MKFTHNKSLHSQMNDRIYCGKSVILQQPRFTGYKLRAIRPELAHDTANGILSLHTDNHTACRTPRHGKWKLLHL